MVEQMNDNRSRFVIRWLRGVAVAMTKTSFVNPLVTINLLTSSDFWYEWFLEFDRYCGVLLQELPKQDQRSNHVHCRLF